MQIRGGEIEGGGDDVKIAVWYKLEDALVTFGTLGVMIRLRAYLHIDEVSMRRVKSMHCAARGVWDESRPSRLLIRSKKRVWNDRIQ